MKKISGLLIVAMIAFTMMAGVASAGTLALIPSGGLTYPFEAANCGLTINLNDGSMTGAPASVIQTGPALVAIQFTPTVDLPSGTRIIFTLNNATFGNTKYWLLDTGNISGAVGLPESATTDGTVLGTHTATFVVGLAPIPANTILDFSVTTGGLVTNPTISINAPAVATTVTLQVTSCFDSVGPLASCLTNSVSILNIYQQFAFEINPNATLIGPPVVATIDVNPADPADARKEFCTSLEGCPHHNGGHHTVRVPAGLVNQVYRDFPAVTWRISLANAAAGTASLDWTLTGAQLNKLDDLYFDFTNNGFADFNIISDTLATLSLPNSGPYQWHDTYIDTLVMTVDGTDILNPQDFFIQGLLNFKGAACYNNVSLASDKVIVWNINGWQGTVPYMYASPVAAEDTFIKIFNNSAIDGQITVDVTPDAGGTVSNISLGTIPGGTIGIFWARDIAAAAGVPLDSAFAAVFTVNAPKNLVTAMANQKRPGGVDRVVPVYTGDDTTFYKNW